MNKQFQPNESNLHFDKISQALISSCVSTRIMVFCQTLITLYFALILRRVTKNILFVVNWLYQLRPLQNRPNKI